MDNYVKTTCLLLVVAAMACPTASYSRDNRPQACSSTTKAAFAACLNEGLDDFWIGNGKCQNESEVGERGECLADNKASLKEFRQECGAQRDAREDLCDALGQAPYDPVFETGNFVNPDDIGGSVAPNPWLPLIPGRTLVYKSPTETIRVTVTHETKVIDDVPCRVVRDVVKVDGELLEDTIDWLAQDVHGNVWYCGEVTAEYEDGFPVNTDGSFQADVDGARPGLLMKAAPAVGDFYREEFDLGNAEDAAMVINLHGSANTPAASCAGDCLVIREFTPLSPDAEEDKYYKAGVGNILTIDLESGERTKLVKIIDGP
ncbi:MAG: hypothetical protein HW392_344 [Steroidobacteraceae bacterium]|nr:hypothetical protein [Steroidobacteraceae bacterium]